MSYTKIKNISIKKDKVTITSAESNIYPISYHTYENKWGTELVKAGNLEELIGELIYDFACGNLQSANDFANRKFLYALAINKEITQPLFDIIWNSYDWETRTERYTKEQRNEAKEKLIKQYYQNYLIAEQVDKEHAGKEFIINLDCGYFIRKTKYGFKYSCYKDYGARLNFLVASVLAMRDIRAEYNPQVKEAA